MQLESPPQVLPDYFNVVEYINNSIKKLSRKLEGNSELAGAVYSSTPDHYGIRVESIAEYKATKASYSLIGQMISEAIIPVNLAKGRPIAIFKLDFPIHTMFGDIHFVEVPAPRVDVEEVSRYDHIEMVLPKSITLLDFVLKHGPELVQLGLCKQSDIDETIRDIVAQKINPEITVSGPGFKIRFHENDIGTVVEHEKTMFLQEQLGRTYDLLNPDVRG